MATSTYADKAIAISLCCFLFAFHSGDSYAQQPTVAETGAPPTQVATTELPVEIKRFEAGNILVTARERFYEFDVQGNRIQDFDFPTRIRKDDKIYFEAMYGESVVCDSDGVAWMLMAAKRVEIEAEKFVEWAYPCFCLAALDSKNGNIRVQFLPGMPEERISSRKILTAENEIILRTREKDGPSRRFRINKKTGEIKTEVLPPDSPPIDFGVQVSDEKGNHYRHEGGKLLIEIKENNHKLRLERDYRFLEDLDVHPSGMLIMSPSRSMLLIAQPDLEKGQIEIVKKIKLKHSGKTCLVGQQNE